MQIRKVAIYILFQVSIALSILGQYGGLVLQWSAQELNLLSIVLFLSGGPLALNTLLLSPLSSCSCFLSQRVRRWRWESTTPLRMYWTLSTTPSGFKVGKAPFVCVFGSAFEWERDRKFTRLPMLSTRCSMCGHLNNSTVIFLLAHIDILCFFPLNRWIFFFQTASQELSGR